MNFDLRESKVPFFLKLCLVLFRVSLQLSLKSHKNVEFFATKSLNLLFHENECYSKSRKLFAFSPYTLQKLKYPIFLLPNYIPRKIQSFEKVFFEKSKKTI